MTIAFEGREISKLNDDELLTAIGKVTRTREEWQARVSQATGQKAEIVKQGPGKSFLDLEKALAKEKMGRGL